MPMKMRSKIVCSIIIFSIGITVGKLFDWGYFDLDKNISIIQALTLFVTVGVGLYITRALEREVQNSRVEKDLFLLKVTEIEEHLLTIEKLIEDDNISFLKVTNQLHQLGVKRNLVFTNIKSASNKYPLDQLLEKENVLKRETLILKKMLTNTPIAGTDQTEINVNDNIVTYSPKRIIDILTESNSLRDELFRVKIIINLS